MNYLFICAFFICNFLSNSFGMNLVSEALHWGAKQVSEDYSLKQLTKAETHRDCEALKETGFQLPTERVLDQQTAAKLTQFNKRKYHGCMHLIDFLERGQITDLKSHYNQNPGVKFNGIPYDLIQPILRLFVIRHLSKYKKSLEAGLKITSVDTTNNAAVTPINIDDPDKGLWHNLNKNLNKNYAMNHLFEDNIPQICQQLKDQAQTQANDLSLDANTSKHLRKFVLRCYNASFYLIDMLCNPTQNSSTIMSQITPLEEFYNKLKDHNTELLCPIIQLYAERTIMQIIRSRALEAHDVGQRMQTPNPRTQVLLCPGARDMNQEALKRIYEERERETVSLAQRIHDNYFPPQKIVQANITTPSSNANNSQQQQQQNGSNNSANHGSSSAAAATVSSSSSSSASSSSSSNANSQNMQTLCMADPQQFNIKGTANGASSSANITGTPNPFSQ